MTEILKLKNKHQVKAVKELVVTYNNYSFAIQMNLHQAALDHGRKLLQLQQSLAVEMFPEDKFKEGLDQLEKSIKEAEEDPGLIMPAEKKVQLH